MTLNELLDMQRELQKHSNAQPEILEQIQIAQRTELGEIAQAVKWGMQPVSKFPGWAWWHRDVKPVATRPQVADELADLLCFVLLECLFLGWCFLGDAWQKAWQDDLPQKIRDYDHLAMLELVTRELLWVMTSDRIVRFVWLCRAFGFSRDEIEAAYRDAYNKNVARWTA